MGRTSYIYSRRALSEVPVDFVFWRHVVSSYSDCADPEERSGWSGTRAGSAQKGERVRMAVRLPKDYTPSDDEPFMNKRQKEYFRRKLEGWKEDILRENKETLQHLQDESGHHPDIADRASNETERALELRTRDRQRKLVSQIDQALLRIEDGTYGYCEDTGEPISLKRLDARPIATLSIEAQERHERREKVYRDD